MPLRRSKPALFVCLLLLAAAVTAAGTISASASPYVVQPGDSMWKIASSHGVSYERLLERNRLANPDLILPNQVIDLPDRRPGPAPVEVTGPVASSGGSAALAPSSRAQVRDLIIGASRRYRVNPSLPLALAWWESGWNQNTVSSVGAVGVMQVLPATGDWVGPGLIGRRVNVYNLADNVEVGVAVLAYYNRRLGDPKLALAAYYQGLASVERRGVYRSSWGYINGIIALRDRFQRGEYPAV